MSHNINGSFHGSLHTIFLKDYTRAPEIHGQVSCICASQASGIGERHIVGVQLMFTE